MVLSVCQSGVLLIELLSYVEGFLLHDQTFLYNGRFD